MSESASAQPIPRSKLEPALALLLACSAPALATPPDLLTEVESRARAARVSNVCIDLSLEFKPNAEGYRGSARISFELSDPGKDLRLDLRCGSILRLSVNGTDVPTAASDGNRLMLPARALAAGANSVALDYQTPYERTGNGLHYFSDPADGREYLYTNFEPFTAHRLIPCFDQPDLKSVFRLSVTAPRDWRVIGNMPEETAAESAGGVRHRFMPTRPLSSYLLFVAAGPFAAFADARAKVPARIFARQSMARYVDSSEIFDVTRRGLEFFGRYFDFEYPFPKYDQLWVPEFNPGAMENPGAVTFNEQSLFRHEPSSRERQRRADVILHEMAHMWFGDLVTMRWWDGLWLNESFATYMASLALAEATDYKDAFEEFLSNEKGWAYWQDQLPTTHPIEGVVPDTDTAFSSFDGITYGKGASMLKQLAFFVGPEKFREGVRAYFRKHAWKNSNLSDFFDAVGSAYGKSLKGWSQIHLETSGVNTVIPRLEVAGGKIRSLVLELQAGNGDKKLRPQKLEVALYRAGGKGGMELIGTLPASLAGARTPVAGAAGLPAPDFVWANHGDHAYLRTFLDQASLDRARSNLERLSHGLTRRGVWMTLWEMVRDGKLEPGAYLDVFVAKAPLEKDAKIVQGLFRSVQQCLGHYLVGEQVGQYHDRVHEMAWKELEKAAPGTDSQKAWFELTVDSASSVPALARLEALLTGSTQFEKLPMDPEKRWKLVSRLCSFNRPGASGRIAGELERDNTDMGRRQALKAETSLPDPFRKESFFKRVLEDQKSSMGLLRAGMGGFHAYHQTELSEPYVDRFFDAILALRQSRDQEFANTFAQEMFPANVHEASVLERSEAFLGKHPELPADIRKTLLNDNDELARCLRLRGNGPKG